MESTHEFLARLRRLDVKLWADGGTLRYNAPKETLTPALLTQLREHGFSRKKLTGVVGQALVVVEDPGALWRPFKEGHF